MADKPLKVVPPEPEPMNPYDPAALRVTSLEDVGVERELLKIAVRRPSRTDFFRINPDPEFTLDAMVFEREDDRETYLVHPGLHVEMLDLLKRVRLFTCLTKRGDLFLWPAKLADQTNSRGRSWHESALEIAERAKSIWVRMSSDRFAGAYIMHKAIGDLGEPKWPDMTMAKLLELGFRGEYLISKADHPVLRELNGEL